MPTRPRPFISAAKPGAVQVLGRSFGEIRANTWHRVTLVVRAAPAEGQIHIYVDGTFIGADRFERRPHQLPAMRCDYFFYLLTDNAGNGGAGYLTGLRFIGRNLDYFEVKAWEVFMPVDPTSRARRQRPPFRPTRMSSSLAIVATAGSRRKTRCRRSSAALPGR